MNRIPAFHQGRSRHVRHMGSRSRQRHRPRARARGIRTPPRPPQRKAGYIIGASRLDIVMSHI